VDFGMAKLTEASAISTSGMALGTLAYIAPEQALGDPVDERTDVYGLGVVMYRALTGGLPFDSLDDAQLVAEHLFVAPPLARDVKPDLDSQLEAVITAAMRKRPENRYPTMTAFLHDLERILGWREGTITPPPLRKTPDTFEGVGATARAAAEALRSLVAA
jgi:serine/threonine-protein kinase